MWWLAHKFNEKRPFLKARQGVIRALRAFFDGQGFDEVDTPVLQACPVMDAHIRAFATDLRGLDGKVARRMYLHTSPEFAMKKLLVAGMENIYQICPVFRNAEGSPRHSPEFTILEWYRAGADYTDIMKDCEGLLRAVATLLGVSKFKHKNLECDPFEPFDRISVEQAFKKFADIDLSELLEDTSGLRKAVSSLGLHTAPDDSWDDLFFRVMDAKIEPNLGMDRPAILYDYPVCMASLARRKVGDDRYAERFELYVCGIELANAFSELTDVAEQKTRFQSEMNLKEKLYGERYPVDDDFIKALEHGLPESAGIALGVERLVMLVAGAEDIEQVLWAGRP